MLHMRQRMKSLVENRLVPLDEPLYIQAVEEISPAPNPHPKCEE